MSRIYEIEGRAIVLPFLFISHNTKSPRLCREERRGFTSEFKIEELIIRIEELRLNMIKISEGKSFKDAEVIAASQKLDVALDKYQEIINNPRLKK